MFLYLSFVFLALALIAGMLGFTGIARESAGIARILFFIFLVIFILSFIMGRVYIVTP